MSTSQDLDNTVMEFFQDDPLTAYYIISTNTYNPTTGENVTASSSIAVQAILLDLVKSTNGLSVKFGTEVQQGDKEVFIRPTEKVNPSEPPLIINVASDRIRIGTTEFKIVNMKEINPSSTNVLLYNFHIRR